MKIGNDIYYVGVNDHQVDLFEGQYVVPNGMSYNCLLYTSPSPRDPKTSRMPSSA